LKTHEVLEILYFDERDTLISDKFLSEFELRTVNYPNGLPFNWIYNPGLKHEKYIEMHYATANKFIKINDIKEIYPEEFI